ncbi:uncharacterized protein LOC141902157 [Tubulanus polymorphus]|uniref:uncharacterized protein LOC141902157 n=1 Tax=Tubulanus polymorphus TaxID=672921 RepID=UPI003DA32BB5
MSKIENPDNLRRILARLPYDLKKRWRTKADYISTFECREIRLEDISVFVENEARIVNPPIFGKIADGPRDKKFHGVASSGKQKSCAANSQQVQNVPITTRSLNPNNSSCFLCKQDHLLSDCLSFKDKLMHDRLAFLRNNNLCFNCFGVHHRARNCRKMPCGVCGYRHNILLHRYAPAPNISPTDNSPTDVAVQQNRTTSSFIKKPRVAVGMPIVPVKVKRMSNDLCVTTYALLDTGSNSTFCSEQLLSDLGCCLSDRRPKLPIDRSDIPRQEEIDRWVHLDGVRVSRVDAEVGLIIGSDNSLALEPIEVRSSSRGGPYAVKTIFGWAVNGPLCTKNNRSQPKSCSINSCSIKRALPIMESTVKLTDDGHYELSLPWKHDKPSLPNNRALAKHRFDFLERRFDKDPKLKVEYTAFVDKMINSGFCELIPDEDLNRNDRLVWQERVAFMADVEGMFNQVRRSAIDNRDLFGDDVVETVLRNIYVDDCLKSVCSDESAVDLLSHVIKVLAMGGFRLTQVSSNSMLQSFVTGKSQVIPLKFTTIPRLEVGVIREHSEPSQWNFVDGKLNPADDASRGLSIDEMNRDCRWLKGPDFLWKTEESWPTQPGLGVVESSDVEDKRSSKACASSCKLDLDNDVLMNYFALFSSWSRLKKSVAWILRFKRKLIRRDHGDVSYGPISVGELREAERAILSYVQRRAFPDAFNGSTLKQSSILALGPVRINGLLCVRGRLGRSELSESSKHPIILPKNGHITDLIVRFYHDIYAHRGREYTLSKIRLKFWVVNGKSAVWRTISKCINCRKRNAKLSQQKMSDLPPDRVSPDKPPFSFVGLDYFGPFLVKRGRSLHSLNSLEVCHSLDTDSFISGLRRFIARRGQPEKIRSDNGTNLVGGQRELKDAIDNWNQDKIQEFFLQKEIELEFNPPAASNMRGFWERLIRSVRSVLCAITKEQVLDDESLLTLMCEVEAIVNGRPLTSVSDDPTDLEPLTPNHLLILRSGPTLPPGSFSQRDSYVRRRWRQVQYLADVFWRRWVREYLPLLQKRQKWFNPQRNFVEGDIVLVKDDQSHRSSWPLGRVIETYAGSDSLIRSVKLKTKSTKLVRPVNKCVFLECIT